MEAHRFRRDFLHSLPRGSGPTDPAGTLLPFVTWTRKYLEKDKDSDGPTAACMSGVDAMLVYIKVHVKQTREKAGRKWLEPRGASERLPPPLGQQTESETQSEGEGQP